MKNILIGRKQEQAILSKTLSSNESEMVAVFGRRRVGKTYLVRTFFEDKIDLEFTGVQDATIHDQLKAFSFLVQKYAPSSQKVAEPKSWLDAFLQLITALESKKETKGKRIIFFDELPWLATHKSGFLKAFGFFGIIGLLKTT